MGIVVLLGNRGGGGSLPGSRAGLAIHQEVELLHRLHELPQPGIEPVEVRFETRSKGCGPFALLRRLGGVALRPALPAACYRPFVSDFESYVRAWRERWAEQRQADAEAARRARALAERLARRLRDRYGARRVVLLGSLARGEFRTGSDIDLAAEGIPNQDFFRAGADLEAAAGGLHVDLVPIESANAAFLAEVANEGVVLHDERVR